MLLSNKEDVKQYLMSALVDAKFQFFMAEYLGSFGFDKNLDKDVIGIKTVIRSLSFKDGVSQGIDCLINKLDFTSGHQYWDQDLFAWLINYVVALYIGSQGKRVDLLKLFGLRQYFQFIEEYGLQLPFNLVNMVACVGFSQSGVNTKGVFNFGSDEVSVVFSGDLKYGGAVVKPNGTFPDYHFNWLMYLVPNVQYISDKCLAGEPYFDLSAYKLVFAWKIFELAGNSSELVVDRHKVLCKGNYFDTSYFGSVADSLVGLGYK